MMRSLALSAVFAALLLSACSKPQPPPVDLQSAIQEQGLQASAKTDGENADNATVTLTRFDSAASLTVAIPAGTVLYGGSSEGQRLVTGKTILVVFRAGETTASQPVRTLCLDEFRLTPTSGLQLSPTPTISEGGTTTEETEPLHKLLDCMSDANAPGGAEQIAVWAVAGDLLHKTRDQALATIRDGLLDEMVTERRQQLESRRAELMQGRTHLTDDDMSKIFEDEIAQDRPALQQLADQKATEQLDRLSIDRPFLDGCGYQTANLPLFA